MENQMVKDAAGTISKKESFLNKGNKGEEKYWKQFIFEKEFNNDFYYFFRISYFLSSTSRPYNRFVFHNS